MNCYDYGARFYDPQIGRWHAVDPRAEKYFSQSTYHFSGNNPILLLDMNGMNYSPYFDKQGNFLGVDEEGYKGEIMITSTENFEKNKKSETLTKESLSSAC